MLHNNVKQERDGTKGVIMFDPRKHSYQQEAFDKAVAFIQTGSVVAFPTETVYGLGADATNEEACLKIFKIKNRPTINPLIMHVATIEQAKEIAKLNDDALKLASQLWPGPLSIVAPIKNTANLARSVLAGLSTVALRIPSHPVALELIKRSGLPIAAPSANPSGYISATTAEHVKKHFACNDQLFILDVGAYRPRYGLESTIIDITLAVPTILREGFITQAVLANILNKKIAKADSLMEVKAPGMLARHYAPRTQTRINAKNLHDQEVSLNFSDSNLQGVYSLNLSISGNLTEAASNLYDYLRILDNYAASHPNIQGIAIAPITSTGIGCAINDRLRRVQ